MKTALALLLALTVTSSADAGTRCRSTTMGSTTWTTCESPTGKIRMPFAAVVGLDDIHDMPMMTCVEFSVLWLVGLVYFFITAPAGMSPLPVAAGWIIDGTTPFSLIVLGKRFPAASAGRSRPSVLRGGQR